ncbi:MAG: redox-sensing transcriptional repressor Rex [Geobacteraceae bacterium]|nr:redox-sensing transcriptional repressor Rex [Geobacteraceae bacterium]
MKRRALKIDKLPTVRRLPAYLTILRELFLKEEQFVSSSYLAERMEIEPILVRKDLELTRINGTPRIGYCIEDLIKGIEDFLGFGETLDAFLVGVGQIGTSILYNRELTNLGLNIVAAFDKEPEKIKALIQEVPVFDISRLAELSKKIRAGLAILCVPPEDAQEVTDILVMSGIKGIWNFTSANLVVPEDVVAQKEDLASGLAVLSVKLNRIQPAHND